MRRAALLAPAVFLAAACSAERSPDEVRVFAASSLTEVMQTIAADFEKETGVKVKLNLAASSTLAKQIVAGAPCDVFLSADQEWADFVEKAGFVEPGTRRDLLGNRLLVIVQYDCLSVLDSEIGRSRECVIQMESDARELERQNADLVRKILRLPAVKSVAMGDPSHVPAGRYGRKALESLGLWEEMAPKIVPCESVRAALGLVERNEADAAIVYWTDARAYLAAMEGKESSLIPVPVPLGGSDIRYPVLLTRGASSTARLLLDALDAPPAREIFKSAGFQIPDRKQ